MLEQFSDLTSAHENVWREVMVPLSAGRLVPLSAERLVPLSVC